MADLEKAIKGIKEVIQIMESTVDYMPDCRCSHCNHITRNLDLLNQALAELEKGEGRPIPDTRIFSGEYSKDMWYEINNAITLDKLRIALHGVCCLLQRLEAKIDKEDHVQGKR